MANCKKLEQFPSRILMSKSLEYLDLSGCSKLREFAGFKSLYTFFSSWALPRKNVDSIGFSLQGLRSLKTLKIANVNMSYLPSEIGSLVSLTHLHLSGNKFLCTLPDSVYNLTRLQRLDMVNCNVSYLPSEIGSLVSLTHLHLSGNKFLCMLPNSIYNLTRLQILHMANCNVSYLSSEIGNLISLTHLGLQGNDLCTLPDSIGNLSRLQSLNMEKCNVSYLPSEIRSLISLRDLDLTGNNLCTLPDSIGNLTRLQSLHMRNCNVSYLPSEIGSLISLQRLVLDVNNLCTLSDSIGNLTRLIQLGMNNCTLSHLPSAIWKLNSLVFSCLIGNNLHTIPNDICKLTNLKTLYFSGCARLQYIPELPKSIFTVTAVDCVSLENIELKWLVGVHRGRPILRFKGCHKLAESNFVNNVIKAVIQQVKDFHALESPAIHGFVSHSEIHLTWGEVPRWFEYQSEGSYLSVKVPPLINHTIRSLAVCVIYIGSNSNEKCKQTGSFCLEYHINKVRRSNSFCYSGDGLCSEDEDQIQMYLKFTSMSKLEGGDEVEIFITECKRIQIKKCAAKLIFEVDENNADTNDEALADYISSPSPSAIQEEEEEVDYPTKRRRRS